MALMWGWGPLAIHPTGEEVAAAGRFREAFRQHHLVLRRNQDPIPTLQARIRCEKDLVRLVEKRISGLQHVEIPRGGTATVVSLGPINVVETVCEPLVRRLLVASLTQALLTIEYELQSVTMNPAKFPTRIDSPAFWEAVGLARETSMNWEASGRGMSEAFDPADSHAVESELLVATARAYINGLQGIVPSLFSDASQEN